MGCANPGAAADGAGDFHILWHRVPRIRRSSRGRHGRRGRNQCRYKHNGGFGLRFLVVCATDKLRDPLAARPISRRRLPEYHRDPRPKLGAHLGHVHGRKPAGHPVAGGQRRAADSGQRAADSVGQQRAAAGERRQQDRAGRRYGQRQRPRRVHGGVIHPSVRSSRSQHQPRRRLSWRHHGHRDQPWF